MSELNECGPLPPAVADLVTWIHIGDLHMVRSGEQNFADLKAIVAEINSLFAHGDVSFVYLPGDNADNGSEEAYRAVRECLDELEIPWCAIVGDHDVHEKSFKNFQRCMCPALYGAFTVGDVRFFRLNCFSEPRPDSFLVSEEQLTWLEGELKGSAGLRTALLMHCYPSDLKQGGAELAALIHRYRVRVVDMGHTHYNELSNDGETVYCATRSTGQIEEGPVGYSVVTLDGDTVSWHFKRLGTPALLSLTSPQDVRLRRDDAPQDTIMHVRALAWASTGVESVRIAVDGEVIPLARNSAGVWSAEIPRSLRVSRQQELVATMVDASGSETIDVIRVGGQSSDGKRSRQDRDQDNALGAWPERDLLGTQLGPNKYGRKW